MINNKEDFISCILLIIYNIRDFINRLLNKYYKVYSIKNDIIIIKNNIIKDKYPHNSDIKYKYDFCQINYKKSDIILKIIKEKYENIDIENIKECNFKFILVNLIINNNKKINITNYLKNSIESYYVKDSEIFNVNFKKWLILDYLKENIDVDNITVEIIDQNANSIELTKNQYIKFGLNNYLISDIC
tara:strand:+ start:607 stop:1170 length:564 start_codon:yes stop_codon:yes gene_type:complete